MSKKKKVLRSNKIVYKGPKWESVRPKVKLRFAEAGILNICELQYEGCTGNQFTLTFAHSLHRDYIGTKEEMEDVIRACTNCHQLLDANEHDVTESLVHEVQAERIIAVRSIYEKN